MNFMNPKESAERTLMMGLLPPCAPRDHVEGHHEATVTSDGRTSTSLRSEYIVQYMDNGESEGKEHGESK